MNTYTVNGKFSDYNIKVENVKAESKEHAKEIVLKGLAEGFVITGVIQTGHVVACANCKYYSGIKHGMGECLQHNNKPVYETGCCSDYTEGTV